MSTTPTRAFADRIAGAPISWGVCEVPDWGLMLPASRVLPEMVSVGLAATELGAPGFLPWEQGALSEALVAGQVSLIGGFVPLVLQDPAQRAEALQQAREAASLLASGGGQFFVTAAVQDAGWSRPVPLDDAGMRTLADGLRDVDEVCAEFGLTQVLHPHVDTLVESSEDVQRALDASDVKWCLDTGHLAIGGTDPVDFARQAADRVAHVHLKDVDMSVAPRVLSREVSLVQGVQAGLFRPLGRGDVPIDDVIVELEGRGYDGWYVLEQDCALLDGEPAPGTGPVDEVRVSLDYLRERVQPRLAG